MKSLQGTATLGPLCYFSGRLVWIQDASRAVVSDLAGQYTADLVPRVHNVAVRNPALHQNSGKLKNDHVPYLRYQVFLSG